MTKAPANHNSSNSNSNSNSNFDFDINSHSKLLACVCSYFSHNKYVNCVILRHKNTT